MSSELQMRKAIYVKSGYDDVHMMQLSAICDNLPTAPEAIQ